MVSYHCLEVFLGLRLSAFPIRALNFNLDPTAQGLEDSRYVGLTGYAELDKPFAVVERSGIVAPYCQTVWEHLADLQYYLSL